MIRRSVILGAAVVALSAPALANEIILSPGEIENLGIRFVQPTPANNAGGIEATSRVVLPPAADTMISTLQACLVTSLTANAGDAVVEGQVLAELKSPEFISLQREFLDAYHAHRLAETEYERDTQLYAEGIISARRLEETSTREAIADTALEEHRQLLRIVGMRDADIRSLEHQQQMQVQLLIRAPFDGVIAERLASNGERLDAMSPIYRLVDMSELWLDINIPQEQLAIVRPGASVMATGSSGSWKAVVTTVGKAVDPATQSAIARARLESGAEGFRPGQFVAVRLFTAGSDSGATEVFEIPAPSVTRSGGQSHVFIRSASGVVVVRVELVSVTATSAFVTGGIDAGDAVATSGVAALKSMWLAGDEEGS